MLQIFLLMTSALLAIATGPNEIRGMSHRPAAPSTMAAVSQHSELGTNAFYKGLSSPSQVSLMAQIFLK